MRKKILLTTLMSFCVYLLSSQVPQGFNYQAIARNSQGKEIVNTALQVKVSILSDTTGFYTTGGGTYIWEELQNVTTNSFGLFTILFGSPAATKTLGSAASFSAIDWKASPLYIGTKIYYTGAWKFLGTTRLGSVPYSMVAGVAGTVSGTLTKLNVKGVATSPDSSLFEVKNNKGQTVFAVYNSGVRIYVDTASAKGATKGGFAIGGFSTVKAPSQEFFRVTRDSTRVYVNPNVKGATKGGFAIGGFSTVKGSDNNYLDLTPKNYFIGQGAGKANTTGLYNTFFGYQNGYSNATGSQNIFIGYHAGYSNDSASYNVFIGNESGYTNNHGIYNTFIGYQAGQMNTHGDANVFIGQQAGNKNTTGDNNIFMGWMSGQNKTAGARNIFIGSGSGTNSTTGNDNLFLGTGAGIKTTADYNIFIGTFAGLNNTTGANNIFAGQFSGASNRKGSSNIYLGLTSGFADTTGSWNIFMGEGAGLSNQGSNNLMFGYQSGYYSTVGDWNLFMGSQSGAHNSGAKNLFFGYQSGYTNTSGSANVFMGPLSGGYNSTGSDNVFIGNEAGYTGATGNRNIAIGTQAGYKTNGVSNIFVGYQAGYNNLNGLQNTFIGNQAGVNNTSGSNNIFIGISAGQNNIDGSNNVFIGNVSGTLNSSGALNTYLGYHTGYNNVTGNSNVFLGSQAGFYETGSNRLYISNNQANQYNALIYGEFDTKNLTINGNLGIGKISPVTKLDITSGNWDVFNGEGDFRIGDGTYRFKIGVANSGGGAGDVRLTAQGGTNRLFLGGGGKEILLITDTNVMPWNDNFSTLGASTNRWSVVYAVNGTVQTSDARLKTNINDLGYGLETLLKLNPVSFTWKDDPKNTLRIGLIAQDVQKVLNEVVDTGTDPAKTLGINYSEIVPVLIKAIKEQQSQIGEVKQENSKLKSDNNALFEQVKTLESRLGQIELILAKPMVK